MSLKLITTSLILMAAPLCFAGNYLSIMGGGGEPQGDTTIFDEQIPDMGRFVTSSDWQTTLTFNGGHATTESKLQSAFAAKNVSNTPFTEDVFKKQLNDYEEQIKSGKIKSGDQIMLIISTHGAEKTSTEKTHQISVKGGTIQDFNTGAGSKTTSLDKLEQLSALAEKHNIKLAIVDLSCHSGNSLPLRNKNTCVITTTGPKHYGYAGVSSFSNKFLANLKQGSNLEDIFLKTRENFNDRSFPMISTPVGLEINDELYDPLTPYHYNYDPKHDKYSSYILSQVKLGVACEAPNQFQELLDLISDTEEIKNVSRNARYKTREGRKFKELLEEYYQLMSQQRDALSRMNLPDMKVEEKFCHTYKISEYSQTEACQTYTIERLLSLNVDWYRNHNNKKIAESKVENNKKFYEASNIILDKIIARREELKQQYPDIQRQENFFKEQEDLQKRTTALANRISDASAKLYYSMYKQKSASDNKPNPCKDFVL